MKRIIATIIGLGLIGVYAYEQNQNLNRISRQVTGQEIEANRGAYLGTEKRSTEQNKVYNYDEVVYEHIKLHESQPIKTSIAKKVDASFNIEEYRKKQEIAMKEKLEEKIKESLREQEKMKYMFTEGYCNVKNDIKVDKIATYAYLQCDLEHLGKTELAVSLVPDFYSGALIAQPLYVTAFIQGRKVKLPVHSGAVLNATKTSINIANIVNDPKVKKYMAAFGINSANIVTQKAQEYLEAKRESEKEETVVAVGTGQNTTIMKSSKTKPPKKSDYIAAATVMVLSEMSKALGSLALSELDYVFFVKRGSVLYADMMLDIPPYLRGYMIENNSLVKKQPDFDTVNYKEKSKAVQISIDRGDQ